jgi:hypothetical protein
MKVTIMAFMQNPWFPYGTEKGIIDRYRTNQEFHRRLLSESMSGQRLLMAFGREWFERIWWDNVAPEAADEPRKKTPVDMKHVEAMIQIVKPDLILTFGKMAQEALDTSAGAISKKLMYCHHPNARFRTQSELDQFAQEVFDWVNLMERRDEFTRDDES